MAANLGFLSPTPTTHVGKVGGMDYSTPPHLLDQQRWRLLKNVRQRQYLEQVPRLHKLTKPSSSSITALATVPMQESNRGLWLAWDPFALWQVSEGMVVQLDSHLHGVRPSLWKYNDRVFYCADTQPRYTDGTSGFAVWDKRGCWTKGCRQPSGFNGAFTHGDFLETEVSVDGTIGATFDWVVGERYRIYVTKPHLFHTGCSVRLTRKEVVVEGIVLDTAMEYIVVRATLPVDEDYTQVSDIPNGEEAPPYYVTVISMPSVPAGRYCAVFFDHLVVAGLLSNRNLIAWSDVNDFADFRPRTDNEADTYLCSEHQRLDDMVSGVTGVQPFGDSLLIFTPACIYEMSYTGLPKVMHVRPLVKDVGNGLPYATAALADAVVWFDPHHGSFFQLSQAEGLQNVGAAIADYFVERLHKTARYAKKTWSFVDREKSEVGWWYVPVGETSCMEAVVYNYLNRTWTTRTVHEGVEAVVHWPERAKRVDELTNLISTLSGEINELDATGESAVTLLGGVSGWVYKESAAGTETQDAVVVETGDMLYDTLEGMKEVNRMYISAAGTFEGVKVEVSARERLEDAVSFVDVGTWTRSLPQNALTFASKWGRVFRYRFTTVGTTFNFKLLGYEDNVVSSGARR